MVEQDRTPQVGTAVRLMTGSIYKVREIDGSQVFISPDRDPEDGSWEEWAELITHAEVVRW